MSETSPEQPLDSMLSPRGIGPRTGGYINRFKFQRERLKALQTYEDKFPKDYPVKKALPKLHVQRLEREETNLSSISSKSIETIKLPAVEPVKFPAVLSASGESKSSHYVKHNPPFRTLHLRLYPDHYSRIARSLPSLPSIPGSPGPANTNASPETSPDEEAAPEPESKPMVIPSKHRYEVIAFQKTIHPEKRDIASGGTNGRFRKHLLYHLDESPRKGEEKKKEEIVPHVIKSQLRYQRRHRKTIGDAKSDSSLSHKKWKEDCGCLRCQIIKRQWNEGDALYKIWGEYPCHHVDPKAVTEDDD